MSEVIGRAYDRLLSHLIKGGFRGYEFDDILGSALVRRLAGGNLFLQRLAIQAGRRSSVNLRPLLGVQKLESAKAYAFFARGLLYRYLQSGEHGYLELAREHLSWLQRHYCKRYSGMSWGNAFDFASRGGFIPKGVPTVVWTSHAGESFDLAYTVTAEPAYRRTVVEVGRFVAENLSRLEDESGVCLGYTPESRIFIHNSNLLGAAALLRAWRHNSNPSYYDLADRAIRWSCARINSDGSWSYGPAPEYRWIDSFHTAYNLDSLASAQATTGGKIVEKRIIDLTYAFWTDRFFLATGQPRYYHDKTYPIDIQCAAQAIETLCKYSGEDREAAPLATRTAEWAIENMQKANGAFLFRRGRILANRLESIHWGEATMLSALGCLLWKLDTRPFRPFSPLL
jgi:hypothetical protein